MVTVAIQQIVVTSVQCIGILVRKVTPTNVLIGSVRRAGGGGGGGGGAYHMSGVHVYRAPCLSTYTALHLTAHGADHACQVRALQLHYSSALLYCHNTYDHFCKRTI